MVRISTLKRTDHIEEQPEPITRPRLPRASRAAGITSAHLALWPEGTPPWLSIKERDAAILGWLSDRGVKALPGIRTIRRILNGE